MIKCKICGHESKYRLIEHIMKIHKMDIKNYKDTYGEVISQEYKDKVSKKSKEKWNDDEYRNKTNQSRNSSYTKEVREKMSIKLKSFYNNGGKNWNDGKTKEIDFRLKSIGEKNKINLTGRTKENYEYLQKHSDLMKSIWSDSNLNKKWLEIQSDSFMKKSWCSKISETLTNRILSGEINTFSSFKFGWYSNNKGSHWFSSGLELEAMKLFDQLNIEWYRNNKIKIKYIVSNDEHYYIPDFIVIIDENEYIIEMKGFDWDNLTDIKKNAAMLEFKNYKLFYTIDDLKYFLKKIS
jgi:hypothetical protein